MKYGAPGQAWRDLVEEIILYRLSEAGTYVTTQALMWQLDAKTHGAGKRRDLNNGLRRLRRSGMIEPHAGGWRVRVEK
jgi:hypothetical protein